MTVHFSSPYSPVGSVDPRKGPAYMSQDLQTFVETPNKFYVTTLEMALFLLAVHEALKTT